MAAFPMREPSVAALREAPVYFRYRDPKTRRVLVDSFTASAILAVYDAVNADNRAKLERMIGGTLAQFHRVASFAFQHTST
jgi:hypothetical protein